MRTLVPPPPTLHCDLCHGELRLKQIDTDGSVFDFDIETFVCVKCGHEKAHKVIHDPYAAHTSSNKSHANVG
jgi:hypothetical protein